MANLAAPEATLWMWLVFGYGALVWSLVGAYHVARWLVKKHPLSLFVASMPLGLIVLNLMYLHLAPRWVTAPVVWVLNLVATVTLVFIVDEIRRGAKKP